MYDKLDILTYFRAFLKKWGSINSVFVQILKDTRKHNILEQRAQGKCLKKEKKIRNLFFHIIFLFFFLFSCRLKIICYVNIVSIGNINYYGCIPQKLKNKHHISPPPHHLMHKNVQQVHINCPRTFKVKKQIFCQRRIKISIFFHYFSIISYI